MPRFQLLDKKVLRRYFYGFGVGSVAVRCLAMLSRFLVDAQIHALLPTTINHGPTGFDQADRAVKHLRHFFIASVNPALLHHILD
jgi:hypothetical protein